MDGLLGSEFALVLRDSLNSTPRRHVRSPPPTAIPSQPPAAPSPQKKPRGSPSEFAMPCNMQLEPRLQFAPIPTSPTSPLPASKLIDSPAPVAAVTRPKIERQQLPSPENLGILIPHDSPLPRSPVSPISKPKHHNSDNRFTCSRRQLSSSLAAAAAASRPLEFLATVSVQQHIQPELQLPKDTHSSRPMVVASLPTSPVNSERRTSITSDDKKKAKARASRSGGGSGKSSSTGRVFSCKQCSSTFSQQFNLNKHVRAVHERRRPFECETCHARFQQKSHRTMHHLAVHEKLRQFACDQCNASFSWRGVLKKHRKSIHGMDD